MNPNTSTKTWLRVALPLFGVFLSTQAAWILLAERSRLNHIRLPVDGKTATIAFAKQDKIKQAASLAVVRGDLWAESAFTYGGQLWIDQAMELDAGDQPNTEALKTLTRALRYSPHRGDVWLMFAALAGQYKWSGYQPSLLLKVSCYTAPNELALFSLRLNVSVRAKGVIDDAELQDMVRRDISVILNRNQACQWPKPHGNAAGDRHPNALNQNERHQGQKRSHSKDRSRNRPGKKVKCDHGYRDMSPPRA